MKTNKIKMNITGYCSGLVRTTFYTASVFGLLMAAQPQAARALLPTPECGLTLIKKTDDTFSDRRRDPSEWLLTATSNDGNGFLQGNSGVHDLVPAGTYTLSEDSLTGYTLESLVCTTKTDAPNAVAAPLAVSADHVITIGSNDKIVECTFTNKQVPPTCPSLKVEKVVESHNGGTAQPGDFTLHAKFIPDQSSTSTIVWDLSGHTPLNVGPAIPNGTWEISEDLLANGYMFKSLKCHDAEGNNMIVTSTSFNGGTVNIASDSAVTCTITNTDQPPTLCVRKLFADVQDPPAASTFSYKVIGNSTANRAFIDDQLYDCFAVKPGVALKVQENNKPGWTATYDEECFIPNGLTAGQTADCTIVNRPAQPRIEKEADDATVAADGTVGFTVTVTQGAFPGTLCVSDDLAFIAGTEWELDNTSGNVTCELVPTSDGTRTLQTVHCSATDLAANESFSFHVSATLPGDICCDITNTAELFLPGTSDATPPVTSCATRGDSLASAFASSSIQCEEASICGDGVIGANEQCEASRPELLKAGQSCSSTCQIVTATGATPPSSQSAAPGSTNNAASGSHSDASSVPNSVVSAATSDSTDAAAGQAVSSGGCSSAGTGVGSMPALFLLMISLVALRVRRAVRVKNER